MMIFQRWQVMFELRALERQEARVSRINFRNLLIEAHDALERGNRTRAGDIFRQVYSACPDLFMLSESGLDLLLRLGRFEEAEEIWTRARKRYPNSAFPFECLSAIAYKRGDLLETVRRCEALRKKHARSIKGYMIAAAALSGLGRAQEAETTLTIGLRARPDDVGLRIEYAKIAERSKNWEEAKKRWSDVLDTYDHSSGAVGIANVLTEQGKYDEADQVISDILYKWGNLLYVWIGLVRVMEHKQDWAEAAQRWANVRKRFPMEPIAYTHGIPTILKTAHPEEADAVLLEGIDRLPHEADLWVEYAWLAHRRGDWPEAVLRWTSVCERFAERPEAIDKYVDALAAAGKSKSAA